MPGSEGGDRVHNFFDQGKFSHQHSQQQVVDGNRLVSSGFHWHGNQRHESLPLNFSPGHTASNPDRGFLDRQSSLVHSFPNLQSPQRPHLVQHTSQNGYIHDHHPAQVNHDETDFMGMNRASNQHNPFSRELLNPGAQFSNVPEHHQDAKLEATESPINFDFLGNHQQLNRLQHGMLQSSPRQHSGLSERQLLQQQAMLRNLFDVQRQQQLQKQDTRIMNSVNNLSNGQQRFINRSPSNNTSFQDGSDYARTSQHGSGNSEMLQGVVPPVMQGISNGISFSAEQSAPSHIFGFSRQSVDQSLHGFPISNTRGPSHHHSHIMEKSRASSEQVPTENIPMPAIQNGTVSSKVSVQDMELGSRYGFQKNNNHLNVSSQISYPRSIIGNLPHVEPQQQNPFLEFTRSQGVSSSSVNSKENSSLQTGIFQDAAPLDPTEEQFLFGSDDNIWNAFGKSSNSKLVDYKMVEGSELRNQFPSMQSGSWTALMQSALAETCSGGTGNQEDWSGLNHSGNPSGAAHEPLAFNSSEKQRPSVNNGNVHIEHSLDTDHDRSLEKTGATNSRSSQGIPLSSLSGSSVAKERFQFNSASKIKRQVSEGNRPLELGNLKAHPDENQIHADSGHHLAATLNLKGPSGAWAPQHGTSLSTIGKQANNKSSHGTYMGSVPGNGSPVRSTSNELIMHHRHDEKKRFMHEELQKDKLQWTRNSFSNSQSPIGQVNSNSHVATGPTINSLQDNHNGSQSPQVNYDFNHWKQVGSEVGSENVAISNHPPEARSHVYDSSFNSHDKKIQQQGSLGNDTSGNRLQDTFTIGQSNPNVADMKQAVFNQVAGNSPGILKYQYQSSGQEPNSSTQNDKGKGSNSRTDVQKLHETSPVAISMHHLANKTFQSSEEMVELHNKTGQSRENSAEASRNSSEQNMLPEKHAEESPDTSMSHLQRNQSLGSHTYGLQLGPPHQRFPTPICGPSQAPSSLGLNSGQFLLHHPPAASQAQFQEARSGFSGQGSDSLSVHKVHEHSNASISSGPPNWENQLLNQSRPGRMSNNSLMPTDTVVSQLDHTDNMLAKASAGTQFNSLGGNKHPFSLPSSSYQADKHIQPNVKPEDLGLPSAWTNVPKQHGLFQPDLYASQTHMKAHGFPVMKDELNPTIRGKHSPGSGAQNSASKSLEEDPCAIGSSRKSGMPNETGLELKEANNPGKDGFPFSDTVTHTNLENSRNSVKSDGKPQNSYSLLHQLQVMKSSEIDPNNRDSKRLKVQYSSSDSQQSPSRFGQHQSSRSPTDTEIGNSSSVASGDSKLGNFVSVPSTNQGTYFSLQHGNSPDQNTPTFGQNGSPAVTNTFLSQISPQMAPTWFERYGSLNREKLLPASDVWRQSLPRPLELGQSPQNSCSSVAKLHVPEIPAPSSSDEVGYIKNCSAPERIIIEQSASPQPIALAAPSFVTVVPNKLKIATLELLPWYKEVECHGLLDMPSISACEVKWANATKRIPEEAMDAAEHGDNITVKCKRRLVLTTQLMQQLFDPPPTSVMSSDAYMNYESVVYFTSRVSCGSACSLSGSKNNDTMPPYHNNIPYKKLPKKGDDLLSKVEKDFLARASKLENALSSLENQTSIHDLQIDGQDLEKFSVINRFARFHGRGQTDGPPIMNSYMNSQSHGPQRYVTALPLPRNLPDAVQCLSL